jgi:hypothetical protein
MRRRDNGAAGRVLFAAAVAALFPLGAAAQLLGSDPDEKPWEEIAAQLPAYPKQENLVALDAGVSPHRFFLDAPSISVSVDGVVRYSLVMKTAGGATNVSYEGIRCEMRHLKIYATGHPGGKWAPARDPQWRRIEYLEQQLHHWVLFSDVLCRGKDPVKTPGEALKALRYTRSGPNLD